MFDTDGVKAKMNASVEHFKEELKKVRTGRAHPDMLANVRAEVYGQMTPLNQIANVTIQGASMLLITPQAILLSILKKHFTPAWAQISFK